MTRRSSVGGNVVRITFVTTRVDTKVGTFTFTGVDLHRIRFVAIQNNDNLVVGNKGSSNLLSCCSITSGGFHVNVTSHVTRTHPKKDGPSPGILLTLLFRFFETPLPAIGDAVQRGIFDRNSFVKVRVKEACRLLRSAHDISCVARSIERRVHRWCGTWRGRGRRGITIRCKSTRFRRFGRRHLAGGIRGCRERTW